MQCNQVGIPMSIEYITISKLLNNIPAIFLDELLISFSLCKNTKALFNITPNPNDISIIHGIRFINAALLLISHKSMALFFNPHMNRTKMIEVWKEYSHTQKYRKMYYILYFSRTLANTYRWSPEQLPYIQMHS